MFFSPETDVLVVHMVVAKHKILLNNNMWLNVLQGLPSRGRPFFRKAQKVLKIWVFQWHLGFWKWHQYEKPSQSFAGISCLYKRQTTLEDFPPQSCQWSPLGSEDASDVDLLKHPWTEIASILQTHGIRGQAHTWLAACHHWDGQMSQ